MAIERLDDHLEQEEGEESQLRLLIAKGKEQGFLTYHEVNEHLRIDTRLFELFRGNRHWSYFPFVSRSARQVRWRQFVGD